jgi:hypothetical protein
MDRWVKRTSRKKKRKKNTSSKTELRFFASLTVTLTIMGPLCNKKEAYKYFIYIIKQGINVKIKHDTFINISEVNYIHIYTIIP